MIINIWMGQGRNVAYLIFGVDVISVSESEFEFEMLQVEGAMQFGLSHVRNTGKFKMNAGKYFVGDCFKGKLWDKLPTWKLKKRTNSFNL
jgi:hypothetical protein